MKTLSVILAAVICCAAFFVSVPLAQAVEPSALIASYDFDGDFSDDVDNSTLTAFTAVNDGYNHNNLTSGFGTDAGIGGDTTYWEWASDLSRGGGFWIDIDVDDPVTSTQNYTIGVRFVYDSIDTGYNKIIDYKNRADDSGFYFLSNKLMFYPGGASGPTIYTGTTIIDIIATRDSSTNEFIAYTVENGVITEEFVYDDSSKVAQPVIVDGKMRIGFFHDDNATSSEAVASGRVYSVKVWDGPITEEEADEAMDVLPVLSFDGNDETSGSPPPDITAAEGTDVIIPDNVGSLAKTGMTFSGWSTTETNETGTDYTVGSTYTMTAQDEVLFAKWMPVSYSITYNLDNGTNNIANPATYTVEDNVIFANPEKDGYTFGGWFTDEDCTTGNEITEIASGSTGNVTIFAYWTEDIPEPAPTPSGTQYGAISTVITDGTGNPYAGYTVELHSNVRIEVTDINGKATFTNAPFVNHTIIIKNGGGKEIGRVLLNMEKGNSNESVESGGTIDVTFNENAVSVDIIVQIEEGVVTVDGVSIAANPSTGSGIEFWKMALAFAAVILVFAFFLILRRVRV